MSSGPNSVENAIVKEIGEGAFGDVDAAYEPPKGGIAYVSTSKSRGFAVGAPTLISLATVTGLCALSAPWWALGVTSTVLLAMVIFVQRRKYGPA